MLLPLIRKILLGAFFCTFLLSVKAQRGNSTEHLYTFIKVWGFLKYYHPALASGKMDADSIFKEGIKAMVPAKSDAEFKKWLAGMLRTLGPVDHSEKPDSTKLFTRNQNFEWIQKLKLITPELRKELIRLQRIGYSGDFHRYMPANFHETQLPGETPYPEITYPDKYWQLLSLARYWNAIEYLYAYKYMLPVAWDKVLQQQIPEFNKTLTSVEFEIQLMKLNAAIEDSHGGAINIKNKARIYGSYFPPFYVRFVGDSLVVTDYIDTLSCTQQNIRPGDVIYSIADKPVSITGKEWYVSASNINKKKAIMSAPALMLPLRGTDSVLKIGYLREGNRMQSYLQLKKPSASYVQVLTEIYRRETGNGTTTTNDFVLRSIDTGVAVVDAANLSILYNSAKDEKAVDSVFQLMRKHSKAIILDMRCYATQAVFYNKFLGALGWPLKPFLTLKAHSTRWPGAFYTYDIVSGVKQAAVMKKYTGKVILLVDSRTHSQSEMITMIFQASGPAIVVGTQSSGADGDVIDLPLPGDYELSFSGRHVSYIDGTPSQMSGVKRDVKVKLTTKGVAAGRDEILEAALQLVRPMVAN